MIIHNLMVIRKKLTTFSDGIRNSMVIRFKWTFVIQWSFVGDTMTLEMVIRNELVSFKESNRFAI